MERLNQRRCSCDLNSWESETTTTVSIVDIHKHPFCMGLLFPFLGSSLFFSLSLFPLARSHNTQCFSVICALSILSFAQHTLSVSHNNRCSSLALSLTQRFSDSQLTLTYVQVIIEQTKPNSHIYMCVLPFSRLPFCRVSFRLLGRFRPTDSFRPVEFRFGFSPHSPIRRGNLTQQTPPWFLYGGSQPNQSFASKKRVSP